MGYCKILLNNTDIDKIKLDYSYFELAFHPNDSIDVNSRLSIYKKVLSGQSDFPEGYKRLDIEYRKFKYSKDGAWGMFLNVLNRWWWNYGYNKEYIFFWTTFFLILFTFITYFIFDNLSQLVYQVNNIPKIPGFKNQIGQRLWYSFIYTTTIFFRLTLSIEKINFRERTGTIYLVIVYSIGIICMAYLANFVLKE